MSRRPRWLGAACLAALTLPHAAWATGQTAVFWRETPAASAGVAPAGSWPMVSALALDHLAAGDTPELLAQRAIEREWTTTTDSAAVATRLVGGKSELGGLMLSALVPGAGQLYAEERSGYLFAAAEVVGWLGWWLFRHDSNELRDEAAVAAGAPSDSASAWSFERWADATNQDPSDLMRLYAADREAFYDAIAGDDRYADGWSDGTERQHFDDLRERSDQQLRRSRQTEAALWINHLVSAADAMRAVRFRNLPLSRDVEIKASWKRGPMLAVTYRRRTR